MGIQIFGNSSKINSDRSLSSLAPGITCGELAVSFSKLTEFTWFVQVGYKQIVYL